MKIYAGIGSRETPIDLQNYMTKIATALTSEDYILRSGGAKGADSAFAAGAGRKEIYLPWNGFNNLYFDNVSYLDVPLTKYAEEFVHDYHPAAHRLNATAFKFMVRNTYQVLGADLKTPAKVVFCYTADGKASGGTGQAMRIAKDYGIPIVNLFRLNEVQEWFTNNNIPCPKL